MRDKGRRLNQRRQPLKETPCIIPNFVKDCILELQKMPCLEETFCNLFALTYLFFWKAMRHSDCKWPQKASGMNLDSVFVFKIFVKAVKNLENGCSEFYSSIFNKCIMCAQRGGFQWPILSMRPKNLKWGKTSLLPLTKKKL